MKTHLIAAVVLLGFSPPLLGAATPSAIPKKSTPSAGVILPSAEDVVVAVKSNDPVEIERVGRRLGATRLWKMFERGKRPEKLAALYALGLVSDAWSLLPALIQTLQTDDVEIRERATEAFNNIISNLGPTRVREEEIPRDALAQTARLLLVFAGKKEFSAPTRVAAINALSQLRSSVRFDEALLLRSLYDEDANVRQAVAESGMVNAGEEIFLAVARADVDKNVRSSAAAALCRVTRDRLQIAEEKTIVEDESLPLSDRIDVMACRSALDQEHIKWLSELSKKGPEPLRKKARSLLGTAK